MNYNRIVYMRESLELNQRQMANELDVPKATYASWEIDKFVIPIEYLARICNIAGFSLDFALSLSNDKSSPKKEIKIDYKKIGQNIRTIRISNNLTQSEFAKILNTSRSSISRFENGETKRLTIILHDIGKKYKISVDELCK